MTDTYVRERSADGRKDLRYPPAPDPLTVPVYDNHCHLEIADGEQGLSLTEQLDRAEMGDVGHDPSTRSRRPSIS